MYALLIDLACDLPLRAFNAASVEIRRRKRRLNDSGVEPARGHQRWIGNVRYASDSGRIAALPRTVAKGQRAA
jgi:hypothetical protein